MAQGQKLTLAPKARCSNAYCIYSQATGPVNSPLMIAIWRGDIQSAGRMISSARDLNKSFTISCNDGGTALQTTPLINAIEGAHPEMVEFLLRHGANPLFRASSDLSPLEVAASRRNASVAIVRLLLQHGALVDDRNMGGGTPLMGAVERPNNIAVIRELIAAKADIQAVDLEGDTTVMLAAAAHRLEAVKLLVGLGADACAKNNDGETAIDQAKTNLNNDPGKQEIISFLREKCGR
jgi:ankyrin repeat protein